MKLCLFKEDPINFSLKTVERRIFRTDAQFAFKLKKISFVIFARKNLCKSCILIISEFKWTKINTIATDVRENICDIPFME